MKGGNAPLGYTIVEVMIVLAVSGVMFVIASTFINGNQARASFYQGVDDLAARIQSAADQVNDGQYSDTALTSCQVSGGSSIHFVPAGATTEQGANTECVFLGKLTYYFTTSGSNKYRTYQLAGATEYKTGSVTTIVSDYPNAYVAPIDGTGPSGGPTSLTREGILPDNLDVYNMCIVDQISGGSCTTNYSLGFAQSLGNYDPASKSYSAGSQNIVMIYSNQLNAKTGITNDLLKASGTNVRTAKAATMCVTDGKRKAKLSIDLGANGLNVTSKILYGAATCP
jgi:prepilin-type N-terminal cleavage/methylation domain-containing protein